MGELEWLVNETSVRLVSALNLFDSGDRAQVLSACLEAKRALEQALSQQPDNIQANHNLGEISWYLAKNDVENDLFDSALDRCADAKRYYEHVIVLTKDSPQPTVGVTIKVREQMSYYAFKLAQYGLAHTLKLMSDAYAGAGDKQKQREYILLTEQAYMNYLTGPVEREKGLTAMLNLANAQSSLGKFNDAEGNYGLVMSSADPNSGVFLAAVRNHRVMHNRMSAGAT